MSKLMLADDEAAITMQLEERLTSMGYEVVGAASSGEEAVDMAGRLSPDLILMDIVMPGRLDGIDAAEEIKTRAKIPVIFLTAYADDRFVKRARDVQPLGYVVKPFQENELRAVIEVALSRKEMDMRLRALEEKYRVLAEASQLGSFIVQNGMFRYVNAKFAEMLGYTVGELEGVNLEAMILPEGLRIFRDVYWQTLEGGRVPCEAELEMVTRDGRTMFMQLVASVIDYRGSPALVGNVWDVTRRKAAEEEIKTSQQELRKLASHLESEREAERKNMARQLYDEIGQQLVVLKMDLFWLNRRLSEPQTSLLERIDSMSSLADTTIQAVRRASTELRPMMLDDLGLAAAIEWQAEEFQSQTGTECEVTSDPEEIRLDESRSTAIFRVFQEVLANVARHAQATRVKVNLKEKAGNLVLEVADNGRGITEKQICDAKSLGLIEMRERVYAFGGEVKISGIQGKGTTVTVSIPLGKRSGNS